jgi:hypothetical protein
MPTVFFTPRNNVASTVGSTYTTGSGSLVLAAGTGARFGSPSPSAPIRVTVIKASAGEGTVDPTAYTIFQATGRSADILTGLVAIEGTTDQGYALGDLVEMYITAGALADLNFAVNTNETAIAANTAAIALRALDSAVVHLSGNETIAGTKTFSATIAGERSRARPRASARTSPSPRSRACRPTWPPRRRSPRRH